jgi:hypothetical protein
VKNEREEGMASCLSFNKKPGAANITVSSPDVF